jgi:hypothetical protein
MRVVVALFLLALLLAPTGGLRAPTDAAPRATEYPRPAVTVVLMPGYEPTAEPYPAPSSEVGKVPEAAFVTARWLDQHTAEIAWSGGRLLRADHYRLGCCSGVVQLGIGGGDAGYLATGGEWYTVRDTSNTVVAATQLPPRGVRWLPVVLK